MAKKIVTVKDEQNLFDLSLQLYGTVEKALDIVWDNELQDVHQKKLTFIEYEEQKTDVPTHFRTKNITVATNYPAIINTRSFDNSFDLSFR